MFEKVNPDHPDKVADRIAGAIVDLAYSAETDPRIAVEVLLGHGQCFIIIETSVQLSRKDIKAAARRITKDAKLRVWIIQKPQDGILAGNQEGRIRCGDNGIFKGMPVTDEQWSLTNLARHIYEQFQSDGKYIYRKEPCRLIICQSNARQERFKVLFPEIDAEINPLGDWTGGPNVDAGATNRKLGSDMGDSVTGGGLHGKDLSKADVSVNIWCFLEANRTGRPVQMSCAIGDEKIDGIPYKEIVERARDYIKEIGGFEKFAEWGLIR